MIIDTNARYLTVFCSKSFGENPDLLAKVQNACPEVLTPYNDSLRVSQEIQEIYGNYLYLPVGPNLLKQYQSICDSASEANFTKLDEISGEEVLKSLDICEAETIEGLVPGETYRVRKGPMRNVVFTLTKVDGELVNGDIHVLDRVRLISTTVANIEKCEPVESYLEGVLKNRRRENKENGTRMAMIVDGHNVLYRCMASTSYNRLRRSIDRKFVGGIYGFYFTLLKLASMFSEYELHVVFDGSDKHRIAIDPEYKATRNQWSPKFKNNFQENLEWCIRLCRVLGVHLYLHEDYEGDDIIASGVARLREAGFYRQVIHSSDKDMHQLIDSDVNIYSPKESFRGHPQTLYMEKVCEETGLKHPNRIGWFKAIRGDMSDNIPGVNAFNRKIGKKYNILIDTYLGIVNESESPVELIEKAREIPVLKEFADHRLPTNLELTRLVDTLFLGEDVDSFREEPNLTAFQELLTELGMIRELEMYDKNWRIFQGDTVE